MLIQILKTLISDVRQAYVPVILLFLIGGTGTIFYLYETVLAWSIQTINTQIPLWATISLVLLSCLYIREKHKQEIAKKVQIPLILPQYDIKSKLPQIEERILLYVAHNTNIDTVSLSIESRISEPLTSFHLNNLKSKKLISLQSNVNEYLDELPGWSITQLGLTYLNHHEILK